MALSGLERYEEALKSKEQAMKQEIAKLNDRIILLVGQDLIPIFDSDQGCIKQIREQILEEQGVELPSVRIMDSQSQDSKEYVLFIGKEKILQRKVYSDYVVLKAPKNPLKIDGIESVEPAYDIPVIWIAKERIGEAKEAGYKPIHVSDVIIENLRKTFELNQQWLS